MPTVAVIIYVPVLEFEGTVNVWVNEPVASDVAVPNERAWLPFAACQSRLTLVPAGRKFVPVIVACLFTVSAVGVIVTWGSAVESTSKKPEKPAVIVREPARAHT